MNKRDITEAGIKLIAVYTILKSTIFIVTSVFMPLIKKLLFGEQIDFYDMFEPAISALIPLFIGWIIIKRCDWILSRIYKNI
jgi:hypothetical protein